MDNPIEKETAANLTQETVSNKLGREVTRRLNTSLKDLVNKEICHIVMEGKMNERTTQNIESSKQFKDEDITKKQQKNDQQKFDKQNDSSGKYIYNTTQFVSVTDLYEVVGICNNNPENNKWCPVLLKIGVALKDNEKCKFILQVWHETGACVFERKIQNRRFVNWFFINDVFVWEEEISMHMTQFFIMKLFTDKKPLLFSRQVKISEDNSEDANQAKLYSKGEEVDFNSYRNRRICFQNNHVFFIRGKNIHFFEVTELTQLDAGLQQTQQLRDKSVGNMLDDGVQILEYGDLDCFSVKPTIDLEVQEEDVGKGKNGAKRRFEKVTSSETMRIKAFYDASSLNGDDARVCMVIEREIVKEVVQSNADKTKPQDKNAKPEDLTSYEFVFYDLKLRNDGNLKTVMLEELGVGDRGHYRMDEMCLMVYKDSDTDKNVVLAACVHQDETASMYVNFREVSRSVRRTHGRIVNLKAGNDRFFFKVFEPEATQDNKSNVFEDFFAKFAISANSNYDEDYLLKIQNEKKEIMFKNNEVPKSGFEKTWLLSCRDHNTFEECEERGKGNGQGIIKKNTIAYEDQEDERAKRKDKWIFQKQPKMLSLKFTWKNKISITYCQPEDYINNDETYHRWKNATHSLLQSYFKLYSDFKQLQNYFMVAHRNFVSVFNFSQKNWKCHEKFDDWVKCICLGHTPDFKESMHSNPQGTKTEESKLANDEILSDSFSRADEADLGDKGTNIAENIAEFHILKATNIERFRIQHDNRSPRKDKKDFFDFVNEKYTSVYFSNEDQYSMSVFVGRKISNIKFLHYDKVFDKILMMRLKDEMQKELEKFDNMRIVAINNDETNFQGTFMLIAKDEAQIGALSIMQHDEGTDNWYYQFPSVAQRSDEAQAMLVCYHKGVIEIIIDQNIQDGQIDFEINETCQLSCFLGADPEKDMEDLDRQIENRKQVTQIMISNNEKGKSIIISVKQQKDLSEQEKIEHEENEATSPHQDDCQTILFQIESQVFNHPTIDGKKPKNDLLIGCCVVQGEQYGDNRYSMVRVTRDQIAIYDKDGDYQCCLYGLSIFDIKFVDDQYLYCILNKVTQPIKMATVRRINDENSEEIDGAQRKAGIWVIDLVQLVNQKKIESYRLSYCVIGDMTILNLASSLNRLCFHANYSTISMIPFYHRNIFNFIGMGPKRDYLIWRETPMFFIALNRCGLLQTWSVCSGKLIYNEHMECYEKYHNYFVYSADEQDKSYLSGFGQQQHRAISLIKSRQPYGKQKQLDKAIYRERSIIKENKYQRELTKSFTQAKNKNKAEGKTNSSLCCLCSNKRSNLEDDADKAEPPTDAEKSKNEAEHQPHNHKTGYHLDGHRVEQQKRFTAEKKNVIVEESEIQSNYKMYNFKVLSLQSWSDKEDELSELEGQKMQQEGGDSPEGKTNQVQAEAAFGKNEEEKPKTEFKELYSFDFELFDFDKEKLYLSEDCTKLLVISRKATAIIFVMDNESKWEFLEKGYVKWLIDWIPQTVIPDFPYFMQGECSANFLFSKDFSYMIDIMYKNKTLCISRLKKNVDQERGASRLHGITQRGQYYHVQHKIPQSIIPIEFEMGQSDADILLKLAKRINWVGKEHLEFVNDEGISCILKLKDSIYDLERGLRCAIENENFEQDILKQAIEEQELQEPQGFCLCCNKINDTLKNNVKNWIERIAHAFIEKRYREKYRDGIAEMSNDNLEVVSYNKIDNFTLDQCDQSRHFLVERKPIPANEVLYGLIVMMQKFKKEQQHLKYSKKWRESKNDSHLMLPESERKVMLKKREESQKKAEEERIIKKFINFQESTNGKWKGVAIPKAMEKQIIDDERRKKRSAKMLGSLFRVFYEDYVEEGSAETFSLQTGFTLIDWLLMEKIIKITDFSLDSIDQTQKIQLCYNVFPGGLSIFHMMAKRRKTGEEQSSSNRYNTIVNDLFRAAKRGLQSRCVAYKKGEVLEVPLIENAFGNTVIDFVLQIDESLEAKSSRTLWETYLMPKTRPQGENLDNKFLDENIPSEPNASMAALFFANIVDTSIFHDGANIVDAIIKGIETRVPGIADYIAKRFIKVEDYIQPVQKPLKYPKTLEMPEGEFVYSKTTTPIIIDKERSQQVLFDTDSTKLIRIDQFMCDIPRIHKWDQKGKDFIGALSTLTGAETPDPIFEKKVIQIIIDELWEEKRITYYGLVWIPYMAYIIVFYAWSIWFLDEKATTSTENTLKRKRYETAQVAMTWVVLYMSLYFITLEFLKFSRNAKLYISRFKQQIFREVLTIVPPFLVLANAITVILYTSSPLKGRDSLTLSSELFAPDYEKEFQKIMGKCKYSKSFWIIQIVALLLSLLNAINQLSVYKQMSYLTEMVYKNLTKTVPFLIFLAIMYVSTATMFFMIDHYYQGNEDHKLIRQYMLENQGYKEDEQFKALDPAILKFLERKNTLGVLRLDNLYQSLVYVFNISIGNVSEGISDLDIVGWIIFLFTFVFFVIMLMNLLIAIVSEVFNQTWPTRTQNYYKELTDFLSVLTLLNASYDNQENDSFLFVASPLSASNQIEEPITETQQLLLNTQSIEKGVNDLIYGQNQQAEERKRNKTKEARKNQSIEAAKTPFVSNSIAKERQPVQKPNSIWQQQIQRVTAELDQHFKANNEEVDLSQIELRQDDSFFLPRVELRKSMKKQVSFQRSTKRN